MALVTATHSNKALVTATQRSTVCQRLEHFSSAFFGFEEWAEEVEILQQPFTMKEVKVVLKQLQLLNIAHVDACNSVSLEIPECEFEELRESRRKFVSKYLQVRRTIQAIHRRASPGSIASSSSRSSLGHTNLEDSSPLNNGDTNNSSSAAPECIASHFSTSTAEDNSLSPLSVEAPVEQHSAILLPTAAVMVLDWAGNWHIARALIDFNSELNRIAKAFVQQLQLPAKRRRIISHITNIDRTIDVSMQFLVTSTITSQSPDVPVKPHTTSIIPNLTLADPNFEEQKEIDIIIGKHSFGELIFRHQLLSTSGLTMTSTAFGWTVAGRIQLTSRTKEHSTIGCVKDDALKIKEIVNFTRTSEIVQLPSHARQGQHADLPLFPISRTKAVLVDPGGKKFHQCIASNLATQNSIADIESTSDSHQKQQHQSLLLEHRSDTSPSSIDSVMNSAEAPPAPLSSSKSSLKLATAERAQDTSSNISLEEGNANNVQAAPRNLRMVSTDPGPPTVISSSSEADSSSEAATTTPKSTEVPTTHSTTPPSPQNAVHRTTMMTSGELSSTKSFTKVSMPDTSLNPPSIANAPTSPTDCAIVKLHSSSGLEQVEPAVIPELQPLQLIQTPLSVSLTHESKRMIPNSQREKFVVSAQGHRQLLHHQGIDDVSSSQPSIDLQPHPSTKTNFPTIHRQKSFWMSYGASHNKFTSFGLHTKRRHLTIFWQFSFAPHMQKNQRHDSHQLNLDAISSSIADADAVRTYHRVFDDIPDTAKKKKYQVGLNFVPTSGNTTLPVAILQHGSNHHDHEQLVCPPR
jgi:hypothetical protein